MLSNQIIWSKTLLSSYSYLERLCNSIDSLIEKTAVNSYYSFGNLSGDNSIMGISNKIITLSNRKIDYINLKLLIEKNLNNVPNLHKKILVLKFIKNLQNEKIGELLNISKRNFYRKLNEALLSFANQLSVLGYCSEKLNEIYLKDYFIKSIYTLVSSKNYDFVEKAEVLCSEGMVNKFYSNFVFRTV